MKLTLKIRCALLFCATCTVLILFKINHDQSIDEDYEIFVTELSEYGGTKEHLKMPDNLKGRKLAFHQVYEARKVKLLNRVNSSTTNETKVIVVWTPWNSLRKTINYYFPHRGKHFFSRYKCPVDECIVTYKREEVLTADAVLFHLIDTYPDDLPSSRPANQLWVVYNLEAPWLVNRHVPRPHLFNDQFNLTMSYRGDSDIIVKYGFIEASNEAPTIPDSHWDDVYQNKTRSVVWFVSDCDTDSKRENYARELQDHIDVDTYGFCGDKKCFPSQSATCYEDVLSKYKYYLSFENSICKDYVTEKFFNVFNYDIIPIVFGGATYSEIAPEGTYIDANDYPSPKDLARVLRGIGEDRPTYTNMLRRKSSYRSYLHPWMCNLCEKLHEPVKHPPLPDVKEWWVTDAGCRRWNKTVGYYPLNY